MRKFEDLKTKRVVTITNRHINILVINRIDDFQKWVITKIEELEPKRMDKINEIIEKEKIDLVQEVGLDAEPVEKTFKKVFK